MMDITLLGTGGMLPLPGRNLTALYVRYDGRALLIDCGEGTQTAIRQNGLRFKNIEGILITHFHADHLSGLPGLLLTLGNEDRTEPLHMYGPAGLEKTVTSLRAIVPELPYEIIYHEYDQETGVFPCAGMDVTVFPVDHTIPCLGYHMGVKRTGRFDPKKAKEKGVPQKLWGLLQRGESIDGFTPEDVLGAPRRGLSVLYATDTRPVPDILRYGKDADLMILEGMYGEEEKQARAEYTHHMMMQEAAQTAKEAGAREMWLTHYSPATPDPAEYEEALKAIFPNTVVAQDGQSITLQFDKD
ncbi:MAG: ribonuclease Z [Clostridia bacterium]|nr:ribonuclease Z [Clostridia bacterium]